MDGWMTIINVWMDEWIDGYINGWMINKLIDE